mmetsp:Transcript_8659/g.34056  ORF Transcript_8659/g.34056 Transcript_8659/m.34056 type:complete len:130 (-) Transcript_8659:2781-3170(-)
MSIRYSSTAMIPYKHTTGIVGIEALPNAREALAIVVKKVLAQVKIKIPEGTGYRKIVEATYKSRLDIIEKTQNPTDIESSIGVGQIEELVAQAKDELRLVSQMASWKPWEFEHRIKVVGLAGLETRREH